MAMADVLPRVAGPDDLDLVTTTIALAFEADPVWGPAMSGDRTARAAKATLWRILVEGALQYPWSSVVGDGAAVAVWIPPGGTELDDDGQAHLGAALEAVLGTEAAGRFHDLVDRFDANHPGEPPHAYLSLLATHPDHRGRGIGMALLASGLRRLDDLHLPAYLESTNPLNDDRYRSVGFEAVGGFLTIDESRAITTMWRAPR